jgi:hypothetical protein
VVGYGPFSLWVIHKEGLCPSSGDINRLMMTPEVVGSTLHSTNICVRPHICLNWAWVYSMCNVYAFTKKSLFKYLYPLSGTHIRYKQASLVGSRRRCDFFIYLTSDPPRLHTGALLIQKYFPTILCMHLPLETLLSIKPASKSVK